MGLQKHGSPFGYVSVHGPSTGWVLLPQGLLDLLF